MKKQLNIFSFSPTAPCYHPAVTQRRHDKEIQFAADAEWPHDDPANAGIRAEFQLPPGRVMK
jgi:hypothetical protein